MEIPSKPKPLSIRWTSVQKSSLAGLSAIRKNAVGIKGAVASFLGVSIDSLTFDHFCLQASSPKAFNDLKTKLKSDYEEAASITHHGREIVTLRQRSAPHDVIELASPKPGTDYHGSPSVFVEHIAFALSDQQYFNGYYDRAKNEDVKTFEVGEHRGVKPTGREIADSTACAPTARKLLERFAFVEIRNIPMI
ncbi:MAG: hypothetical protein PHG97_03440 [Candidatus Margulisbacteria bacterium]|nr:hypothetical protein [Candidatus Margulisiibacteriota bacterium]